MVKAIEKRATEALRFAQTRAAEATSWIDLHNALYGLGGKCTELFPTEAERVAFARSEEHKRILQLLEETRARTGDPASALGSRLAKANGALSVRLPRALHAALLAEADAEGVSLNQLCLAKLAVQLRAVVR